MKARVGQFDRVYHALGREVINIDVAICPIRYELVARVHDGQQRVYLGGVFDCQGQCRASLKMMVDVPNVNSVIRSSGGERKGLHHRANHR